MNTIELDNQYVMGTYARFPVVFARGRGCFVYDTEGREYLDCIAGLAVNGLGHCHPKVVEAICRQAGVLMHTSNLYHTLPQPKLAKLLVEASGMSKAFFANSGAEANECAIKIARKAAKASGHPEKTEIITAELSFHGRTLATITATGQPKYSEPFAPLPPDFKYVPFNDVEALRRTAGPKTCAILLEPVLGESGVYPATSEFLSTARKLCDEYGAALILDEVQTGLGRTGKLFGFQHYDVVPDMITLAKTLANGFPAGACLARGAWGDVLVPGDHGSTFGGNPLACAAAIACVTEIIEGGWVDNSREVGAYFAERLRTLPGIKEVRAMGLMIGADLAEPNARQVVMEALGKGLVLNATGDHTLRFVPPLIITRELVDKAIGIMSYEL